MLPSEVLPFCIKYKIDQLNIGSNADVLIMTVLDDFQHLAEVKRRLLLRQMTVLFEFFYINSVNFLTSLQLD